MCADDTVDDSIHPARNAGIPRLGCRIDEPKCARAEPPAVERKITFGIISADTVPCFLAERTDDGRVRAVGRRRQNCRDQFDFAFLLRPPLLDQARAKAIKVKDTAADKGKRNDVDRQNPACQRPPHAPLRRCIDVRRRRNDSRPHRAFR